MFHPAYGGRLAGICESSVLSGVLHVEALLELPFLNNSKESLWQLATKCLVFLY